MSLAEYADVKRGTENQSEWQWTNTMEAINLWHRSRLWDRLCGTVFQLLYGDQR